MLASLVKKFLGSRNDRVIRKMQRVVQEINAYEPLLQKVKDEEGRAKTEELRARFKAGTPLDELLPEAFAWVREASVRTLGLRPFDVQLMGGIVLHEGNIAEMRTGEGKTLAATLPAYLNSLTGKGVHIVTVNDYLAKRDSAWMEPVYKFLGLSLGVIYPNMSPEERKKAYAADVIYGTNNEFGFDYLRDNMAFTMEDKVQGSLAFAIVDEVDSILVDEARTPLIISGAADDSSELYRKTNRLIPHLERGEGENGDYTLDEKQRQVFLTEAGHTKVEALLMGDNLLQAGESLYAASNITLLHHLNAALRAHALFHKDVDYIVKDGEVVIVDEHTGRTMQGRRWSDGLHQAIEAKEGVAIQNENQTLASITLQNYFRLYDKLSGMTGTADTEAYEFQQIYNLEVVVIPTHKLMIRKDLADLVYLTQKEKFEAIIQDIQECMERKQPVLVGTASIETSELVSSLLKKAQIEHQVLNAKFHEKEAHIIAEAGRPGMVTIATNMAGRGTDIVLGGSLEAALAQGAGDLDEIERQKIKNNWQKQHDEVINAGGLRIIGSERHESRRIDNQLRGRAGRQGDPGSSRFYLSLEDNLMRIFASDRVSLIMKKLGMEAGEAIEHPWVTRAIEGAQRKVEGFNFDIRKQLLQYDNVANDQRKIIYHQRTEIMETSSLPIDPMREEVLRKLISHSIPPGSIEEDWNVVGLEQQLETDFGVTLALSKMLAEDPNLHEETLYEKILEEVHNAYKAKDEAVGRGVLAQIEKSVLLQSLDLHWREHLAAMDHLRLGIHLRGYAQKDPRQEYKREAFLLFSDLLDRVRFDTISILSRLKIQAEADVAELEAARRRQGAHAVAFQHASPFLPFETSDETVPETVSEKVVPFQRNERKVGRNEICPCGSLKKYKYCHGQFT